MAAKKTTTKKKATPRKPQEKWVRNLRNVHVSLTIEGRRIEMAPRGQRGDLVKLQKNEYDNVRDEGSLAEIVTGNEAAKILSKQAINVQRRHPALDTIRNPLGEEYGDDAVKVEEGYEEQGKKVADLTDGQVMIDRGVGIRRSNLPGTEENPIQEIPDHVAPEEQADYLARKGQSAQDVLGDVSIVREDTQKGD